MRALPFLFTTAVALGACSRTEEVRPTTPRPASDLEQMDAENASTDARDSMRFDLELRLLIEQDRMGRLEGSATGLSRDSDERMRVTRDEAVAAIDDLGRAPADAWPMAYARAVGALRRFRTALDEARSR